MHSFENNLQYALSMDQADSLKDQRAKFHFPKFENKNCIYFCGNSLGLQPFGVEEALLYELKHWQKYGVEGHFEGKMPWKSYHHFLKPQSAKLVGAKESEVTVMNVLTVNLHLMMVSFYRPTKQRFKIIMEGGAFPSDQYAIESQVKFHGFDPETAIVELKPRNGEHYLRSEDILSKIKEEGDSVALVMMGGVNYYSGQYFDLENITKAGHEAGAIVGFDLAHAAGNLPLQLHDWNVDFAVWCSYKYLNSGPGGPSGVFVHEQHGNNPDLPRFAGWWGYRESDRFEMKKGFVPMEGADGWQLSNAQIFSFAAHKVSLDMFESVGMEALRAKSLKLSGYLYFLLNKIETEKGIFKIISPPDENSRGAQISLLTDDKGKDLYNYLSKNGVICDWREPNVIRVAPVPMYNSFEDVWRFADLIDKY